MKEVRPSTLLQDYRRRLDGRERTDPLLRLQRQTDGDLLYFLLRLSFLPLSRLPDLESD